MNGPTHSADMARVRRAMIELTLSSDEPSGVLPDLVPPSESRGAVAMQSRIHRRMFGSDEPLETVGHYEIVRRIGAGAMGVVYAARNTDLQRDVALKLLRWRPLTDTHRHRVLQEARALAKISHPNVVPVYEVGEHDADIYIAMEYVEGETLLHWQARPRSLAELLAMYRQAGAGLAAAHAVGVVHRDFKPGNALVGRDDRLRVVDFGLAWVETGDGGPLGAVGTPGYIAPELRRGAPATAASDQYSFCVALTRALTPTATPATDPSGRAADDLTIVPRGPSWLRRVLQRGLADDPASRWPSMTELVARLDRGRHRQRLGAATLLGAGLTAGAMIAAISLLPSTEPTPPACPDSAAAFVTVWSADRQTAMTKLLGSEADRLRRAIDSHRDAWLDTHTSACRSARIEQLLSERQLELAYACLERDRAQVDALLDIVESSPGPELDLRRLLQELDDPRQCADATWLASHDSTPAEIAPRVAELGQRIDQIALVLRVEPATAAEPAATVVDEARRLAFAPILAEALALDGEVALVLLEQTRASASLREATRIARATSNTRLEFACLRRLVLLTTAQYEDPERAGDLLALMLGSFESLGQPADLLVETLLAQSELTQLRGDLAETERLLRRAIDHLQGQESPDDVGLEDVQLRLANVFAAQGRTAEMIGTYEALLTRLRDNRGPRHPSVATIEFNLAHSLIEIGDPDRALEYAEQALRHQRDVYGTESPKSAPALILLAQAKAGTGDLDGAIAAANEAWLLERKLARGNSERGNSLRLQAALLDVLGRYDDALAVWLLIESELRATMLPIEQAMTDHSIGWLLCRVGDFERARGRFERAIGSGQVDVRPYAELGLAEVDLAEGLELGRARRGQVHTPAVPDQTRRIRQRATRGRGAGTASICDHRNAGVHQATTSEMTGNQR
jgi:serine/threonine protein kinase/tetratricopeptide (TPR) repeat protein